MVYDEARQRTVLFGGFGTGPLDETWEWDGTSWIQRSFATRPSARQVSAMTYDSARERVVLFGGYVATSGGLGDTWEYDGASWTQRFPAHSPPATFDGQFAYDAARGVCVLLGGTTATFGVAGHWEWDGNDWREVRAAPLPRQGHGLAHDPLRDRTVLFGGNHDPVQLDDTWEWDGERWERHTPPVSPSGRVDPALVFDGARGRVLLFGGEAGGTRLDDTWEWDGAQWIERFPATRPPARRAAALAYDEARGRVLLFGGDGGQFTPSLSDTWEWDGNDWLPRTPATVPPARTEHVLVYDARRARVVLFGGQACLPFQGCTALDDTFEWDGTDWLARVPALAPAARGYAGATYDRQRARTLLFGGLGGGVLGELEEWDGNGWRVRATGGAPGARYDAALAFDAEPGRALLFGGVDADFLLSSETFELAVGCDALDPGHASGSLAIGCNAAPRLGTSFCVEFADPLSAGASGLLVAPGPPRAPRALNLPLLCAPGILHVPAGARALFGSGNPASYCITLAPSTALIGASFVLQGAALETGGCWRLTDGLVVTLQP